MQSLAFLAMSVLELKGHAIGADCSNYARFEPQGFCTLLKFQADDGSGTDRKCYIRLKEHAIKTDAQRVSLQMRAA